MTSETETLSTVCRITPSPLTTTKKVYRPALDCFFFLLLKTAFFFFLKGWFLLRLPFQRLLLRQTCSTTVVETDMFDDCCWDRHVRRLLLRQTCSTTVAETDMFNDCCWDGFFEWLLLRLFLTIVAKPALSHRPLLRPFVSTTVCEAA